jgi:hypothetical protein
VFVSCQLDGIRFFCVSSFNQSFQISILFRFKSLEKLDKVFWGERNESEPDCGDKRDEVFEGLNWNCSQVPSAVLTSF